MARRAPSFLWLLCAAAWLLGLCAPLGAVDVNSLPKPTGYVSDLAHVVDADKKNDLEQFCGRVEREVGVQFALVTIDTLDDQPIENVALDIFRKWGVGDQKTNQGVLLLLVIKDRKSDIETGRGIEPYLTDGFSGGILRSLRPQLRSSDYGGALLTGAHAMASEIANAKGVSFSVDGDGAPPAQVHREGEHRSRGIPGPLIVLAIFAFFWLIGRGGRRGGGGGYRGGGGGSFLTGMLLGNLLGGGRRSDGWGGDGGWGSGGGFGGGDSGGGFGGFGGGDAGGGGANSNW